MRRGAIIIGLTTLCALLTACAAGGGGGGASPGATSTASGTPTPNILALNGNDTSSQAMSACGGVFSGGGDPQIVYKLGDSLYAEAVYGLPYASYQLPADLPVAP